MFCPWTGPLSMARGPALRMVKLRLSAPKECLLMTRIAIESSRRPTTVVSWSSSATVVSWSSSGTSKAPRSEIPGCLYVTGRRMSRLPSLLTACLVLGAFVASAQAQDRFTATVSFQKGVNGYEDARDDSMRPGKIKLGDDRKRTLSAWHEGQIRQGKLKRAVVLEQLSNYRHVLRWDGLDKWIRGNNVKILSAKVDIFYTDEFWSFYDYEVALYRSLDGTKDRTRKEAVAVTHIFGERRGRKAATPFRSWITFDLRPEVIQAWVDAPAKNKGLVLLQHSKTDPPGSKSTGGFVVFASNTNGLAHLRPKLTIVYEASGNVAPFAPALPQRFDEITVGREFDVHWTMPEKADLNGDTVHFELAYLDGNARKRIATDIPADRRGFTWQTCVGQGPVPGVAAKQDDCLGAAAEDHS